MSKVCEQCGKRPGTGCNVSHSHRRTLRRFVPNLQKKRIFDPKQGKLVMRKLCTKCLRTLVKVRKVRARKTETKGDARVAERVAA